MITYVDSISGVTPDQLAGFFVSWPNPPTPTRHWQILAGSDHVILALESKEGRVVGFITAISDGVLTAFIPLLEVLPMYRGRGIGQELMRRMLEKLDGLYAVDLFCDPSLQRFYARFGMHPALGMSRRDYRRQSGE